MLSNTRPPLARSAGDTGQGIDAPGACTAVAADTGALADGAAEADIQRLTAVYQAMKPKDAAALFNTMSPEFAAGFLGRMQPQSAAAVLAALDPQAAFGISALIAGRNAKAPTE